jgi:hypothetical protein
MSWVIAGSEKVTQDPYLYTNTVLLLKGDGTNGSTTILDSSKVAGGPKTVTAGGNAQISTAIADPFGNSTRGVIALDGTGDYLTATDNLDFSFGTGNFTIEFWLYLIATATNNALFGSCLVDTRTSPTFAGHSIFVRSTGSLRLWENNADAYDSATSAVPFSNWCHIATSRASGTTRAFVNGSQVINYAVSYNHTTPAFTAGGVVDFRDATADFKLNGYIDDLRITKGIARYTANFTPPTAPFPDI